MKIYGDYADSTDTALAEVIGSAAEWREAADRVINEGLADLTEDELDEALDDDADLCRAVLLARSLIERRLLTSISPDGTVLNVVLTYMFDHLGPDDPLGTFSGLRLIVAAKALQCRYDDVSQAASDWLDGLYPDLLTTIGSFFDLAGFGAQFIEEDSDIYIEPAEDGGLFCFRSVTAALENDPPPAGEACAGARSSSAS